VAAAGGSPSAKPATLAVSASASFARPRARQALVVAQFVRLRLAILIVAFVLVAGVYSVVVPPFETPDEIWHFAFIQYVASGRGLPVSAPHTAELWRQQGVQAPAYYLVAALLTGWIDQSDFPALYARTNPHAAIGSPDATQNRNYLVHHADESWPWHGSVLALHLARFLSVFLGALTVWAVYKTLALLLSPGAAWLGAALYAFIPQFVFISAAASNDNAINAMAGLVLWRLVALLVSPPPDLVQPGGGRLLGYSQGNLALLSIGLLLGGAVLSKLSALGLVALAGLVLLVLFWQARSWRLVARAALWTALPALTIGGWWYLRNWRLYRDPLAWNVWQANILLRAVPSGWRTILSEMESLERSFWGLFGWLNLSYPSWLYGAFRLLEVLVLLGWVAAVIHWLLRVRRADRCWLGGALLLVWVALLAVSWVRFMLIAPAAQGRYFHPAGPSIALLLVLGLGGVLRNLSVVAGLGSASGRRLALAGWGVPALAAAGLFALSASTPFWLVGPAYTPAGALLAASEVSPDLLPLRAELGGQFAILGVAAEPIHLLPGGRASVTVRWQALDPGPVDYSIFVQLLDADGLVVAQADTMPAGGLLPTSAWPAGLTRTERYAIDIPATAYAPDQGRWLVGMYNHVTGQRLALRLPDPGSGAELPAALGDGLAFGHVTLDSLPGSVPNPVEVAFADNLTLAGYSLSSRRLRPGDTLTVNLYWRARGPVGREYTPFAHLLDSAYQTHGGHDGAPRPPAQSWPPGQILLDAHTFVVAPDASPGRYQLEIGLYTRPEFDRLPLIQPGAPVGADRLLLGPLVVEQ
jgi:4-amino-4-deoxy-L-arabinose transferase-like glycosyltransferase